jgi:hypothetical protein
MVKIEETQKGSVSNPAKEPGYPKTAAPRLRPTSALVDE